MEYSTQLVGAHAHRRSSGAHAHRRSSVKLQVQNRRIGRHMCWQVPMRVEEDLNLWPCLRSTVTRRPNPVEATVKHLHEIVDTETQKRIASAKNKHNTYEDSAQ